VGEPAAGLIALTEALNIFRSGLSLRKRAQPCGGPLLLNIDAIGAECSRVLQPARIQQKKQILEIYDNERES
jgi:hypothetical protein